LYCAPQGETGYITVKEDYKGGKAGSRSRSRSASPATKGRKKSGSSSPGR